MHLLKLYDDGNLDYIHALMETLPNRYVRHYDLSSVSGPGSLYHVRLFLPVDLLKTYHIQKTIAEHPEDSLNLEALRQLRYRLGLPTNSVECLRCSDQEWGILQDIEEDPGNITLWGIYADFCGESLIQAYQSRATRIHLWLQTAREAASLAASLK